MSSVTELMAEYFRLKDEGKAIREERAVFMGGEGSECLNMHPYDPEEAPLSCVDRARYYVREPAWDKACEPCLTRHGYYLKIQELGRRRTAILGKVKRLVRSDHEQTNAE